jgi:diguanylate cyclase (GGDEF)-like protein
MIVKLSIALFGPVVLGLYLQYDYAEYGSGLVEHFLKPKRLAEVVFHAAMFFLPVLTVYSAYLLNQREKLLAHIGASKDELQALSLTDELTGLFNRRGLTALLGQEIKRVDRLDKGLSLIYMDLDNLKKINDQYGHKAGDSMLVEISSIIKEVFRDSDIMARIGGDEFVVVPIDGEGEIGEMICRLKDVFKEREQTSERPYSLSVSMGTAYYNPHSPATVEELLNEADSAMYDMKKAKHGRC